MKKLKDALNGYRFGEYYKEKAKNILRYELLKIEHELFCYKVTNRKIIRALFQRLSIEKIAEALKMSTEKVTYYIENDMEQIISNTKSGLGLFSYDKGSEFWHSYELAEKSVNNVRASFYIEHNLDPKDIKLILTMPEVLSKENISNNEHTLKKKEFVIDIKKEEEKNELFRRKNYQFLVKCEKELEEELTLYQNNIINEYVNLLNDYGMSINYISDILNINNEIVKEYIDNPYKKINEDNSVSFYSLGMNLGDEYTKKIINAREDYLFFHKEE